MLLSYVNGCGKPLKRLKCSPCQRQRDRSSTMIGKLMPFHWNQVTWSWLKLTCLQRGGGKWRTGGRRNHMKWSARLLKVSLPTSCKEPADRMLMSPPPNFLTFSHCSYRGGLLSVQSCELSAGQVHHHHPRGTNSGRRVRLRKHHKVWIVHCQPSIRQVRLL